jgi:hypothetical protein
VIQDRNEELAAFCAKHFAGAPRKPKAPSSGHHSGLTDEEVLSLIRGAERYQVRGSVDWRHYRLC